MFEQFPRAFQQSGRIIRIDRPLGQYVLFKREKPAVNNVSQGTLRTVGSGESLGQSSVYCLQTVQRSLRFGDLNLRRREALLPRGVCQPACKERLAAAVLATHGLEESTACADAPQFFLQNFFKATKTDGECVETVPWDRAATQSVDDFLTTLRADTHACS